MKGILTMKKIILTVLICALCLLLCACAVNQPANTDDNTLSQQKTENQVEVESTEETTTKTNKKEIKKISIGETITTDSFEFTLNKVELSYDVKPDNPPTWYSHYQADNGQVYIYVNASVKNLKKQSINCDEIYSVKADYNGGYEYSGYNIVTDTDGDFTYANITSLTPLQTLGVHCLIDCPEEVETSDNPLVLTIELNGGEKFTYTVR